MSDDSVCNKHVVPIIAHQHVKSHDRSVTLVSDANTQFVVSEVTTSTGASVFFVATKLNC